MRHGKLFILLAALVLPACQGGSGPGGDTIRFNPPSTQFVKRLGFSAPVTKDQAMAIAAEAAGGTAISVSEEKENKELLFEVKVQTPGGRKEVEVRASDGAVVEIEPDDDD